MYLILLGGGFTRGLSGGFDIKCAPGCGDFCVFGTPKKQIPHIAPRWGGGGGVGEFVDCCINEQWHVDLTYFSQWASDNNDVQYLLIIIDVFSRQLQVSPLKNKTGKDVVDAFSKLTTLPKTLRTDGGSEFTNELFQSFLKNNSIRHYIARNDLKLPWLNELFKL